MATDSVTVWIEQLRNSNPQAARELWERFFDRMVTTARRQLGATPRRAADEEDVAVIAFEAFLSGVKAGRFPRLNDREELWNVLLTLTLRKTAELQRHETRQKRGGGVREEMEQEPLAAEPSPAEAAACADEVRRMLGALDDELRRIALWRMEGYSSAEIATRLECAVSTVERRLRLIRHTWQVLGVA